MASSMVIKVKFGEMLRRFNATVSENNQLDLDMAGLKAKVSSLFSFNPDADISLTYVDEDGDVVALIDDDDLCDVMRQQLKFLRIDVQLNTAQGGRPYVRSSGSSTPLRSPRDVPPVLNMNRVVTDVLQSMPAALQTSLMNLSADLASKAASSSPAIAEIVDAIAKMGLSGASPVSQSNVNGETNANNNNASESLKVPAAASGSKTEGKSQDLPKSTENPESSSKSNLEVPKGSKVGAVNANVVVGVTVTPRRRPTVDLNKLPVDCESSEPSHVKPGPAATCPVDDRKMKKLRDLKKGKSTSGEASGSFMDPAKNANSGPQSSDWFLNPFNECPFFGVPIDFPPVPPRPFHSSKRHHAEAMGGVFHRGVHCDGCGVHPITGPRFKSKVKENYDLCSICFSEMGTEAEYLRIDRPMSFRHPRPFKGPHEVPLVFPPVLPRPVFGCGSKSGRSKLDSRFILDVNVNDGTLMPPSVPFTKIWRMRNNGSIVWPQGTQLVWIGGDRFSDAVSVEMEIPANGVPLEGELDIAVDFIAPGYPGRYVSYWRMSSPSGQKFGQRVWVLIQVDASLQNSFPPTPSLNLNLDGPLSSTEVHKAMDAKEMECDFPQPGFTEPETPMNDHQPKNEHENEHNFPINDSLLVGHGVSAPPVPMSQPPVSYPIIDLAEDPNDALFVPGPYVASPVVNSSSSAPPVVNNAAPPTVETSGNRIREEALLRELEEMGFKQVDLNKEILRMNEYDLEQSVDDLCGVTEWDPMLEELDEMGFHDAEMNKKLLAKNNGSIKRVVMDLINGEKP